MRRPATGTAGCGAKCSEGPHAVDADSRVLGLLQRVNLSKPSSTSWCIWHGLAIVAIVLVPIRLEFDVIWNLDPDSRVLAAGAAVAYLLGAAALTFLVAYRGEVRAFDVLSTFGLSFAGLYLFLAMNPPVHLYPRRMMLLSLLLAGIFAVVPLVSDWSELLQRVRDSG